MGQLITKLFKKSRRIMLDKANFTSEYSADASRSLSDSQRSLPEFQSTVDDVENLDTVISLPDPISEVKESMKPKSEINVDTYSSMNDEEYSNKVQNCTKTKRAIRKVYLKHQIQNLGINEIPANGGKPCFSGILYLPECELLMAHYLALYRLKLDTLSQFDFERWCFKVGHQETSKKYSQLVSVYGNMKRNHFKDSYIVNRIISRQNVHFKISDLFGEVKNRLRALIIVGDRRSIVQNVLDCYCFAVKGKIPFVIKSADEYRKCTTNLTCIGNQQILDNFDLLTSYTGTCYQTRKSRIATTPKKPCCTLVNDYSNVMCESNSINKKNTNCQNINPKPKLHSQKKENVDDPCFNNTIFCDGDAFKLVSVIADKSYAYILCRNANKNSNYFDNLDFDLIKEESISIKECEFNQSNTFNRIGALKKLLRTEILECCNKRYYGVALPKVQCGEFYVVRCSTDGRLSGRDRQLHEALIRNNICGKVIDREYNMDAQSQGEFLMHLHGDELDVLKCCKELKLEGLAKNFQLIRPYSFLDKK